jgi:hypothetical protein
MLPAERARHVLLSLSLCRTCYARSAMINLGIDPPCRQGAFAKSENSMAHLAQSRVGFFRSCSGYLFGPMGAATAVDVEHTAPLPTGERAWRKRRSRLVEVGMGNSAPISPETASGTTPQTTATSRGTSVVRLRKKPALTKSTGRQQRESSPKSELGRSQLVPAAGSFSCVNSS